MSNFTLIIRHILLKNNDYLSRFQKCGWPFFVKVVTALPEWVTCNVLLAVKTSEVCIQVVYQQSKLWCIWSSRCIFICSRCKILSKSQQIQINSMKLLLPKIDEFSLSKLKWNTHDKITSNIDFHDCEQWYLSRVWFRNSKTQRTSAKLRAIPRPVLIMSVEALPSLITDKIRKTIFDPSIKNYLCICNNICLWNDTEHQIWKQRQMGIFCEKDLK